MRLATLESLLHTILRLWVERRPVSSRVRKDFSSQASQSLANLSLVTLFTMHLLRAIPNAGKYLEFSIEGADYYPWQEGIFTHCPYEIEDGHARVTDAPGWGVEINPEWLAQSIYQISEVE